MSAVLAYLDPGSGSLLVQILLGGAAAAGVTLKLFWRRLRDRFRGGRTTTATRDENS